jgi:hypothetical protein
MRHTFKLHAIAALGSFLLLAPLSPAMAAEELTVNADQSQVIRLDRAPGTVVVGNPTIADVTIQGSRIFVHGRVFGKTNVIVFDEAGSQLAEYNVNVTVEDAYNVVVFKPLAAGKPATRESFSCKTDCESALQIGDDADYFKMINEQQKNKLNLAQGQKPGDKADNGGGNGGDGSNGSANQ